MLFAIIGWILIGAIVGYIARLLMPGPDPMGFFATAGLGVGGSLVGGLIGNLVAGRGLQITPAGLIGSVLGAMLLLFIIRRTRGRGPGRRRV